MTMLASNYIFEKGAEMVSKPFLSRKMVVDVMWQMYELRAENITRLPSFCDQNFQVVAAEGGMAGENAGHYVLKIINSDDSLHRADAYAEIVSVLEALQGENGVLYPAPLKNVHGQFLQLQKFRCETDEAYGIFLVLLLSYIPGVTLSEIHLSNQVIESVGKAVANFTTQLLALKRETEHLKRRAETDKWCLTSVAKVQPFITAMPEGKRRLLAADVLKRFLRDVKPLENCMPKGVVHVDLNRANILVKPVLKSANQDSSNDITNVFHQSVSYKVSGIIDFLDMAYECVVYDVAGSLADIMIGRKDQEPLIVARHFLAGYTSVRSLNTAELRSVFIATAARLAQLLVLMQEYFRLSGESDQYIIRLANEGGWELLEKLWQTPKIEVEAVCGEFEIIDE